MPGSKFAWGDGEIEVIDVPPITKKDILDEVEQIELDPIKESADV
jgi:hypothetical protein